MELSLLVEQSGYAAPLDVNKIYSIHSLMAVGEMWDNVLVSIQRSAGSHHVTHYIQNTSKHETLSLAAGQAVAQLCGYTSVDEYLESDAAKEPLSDYINIVVTEPLEYTKNKQQVAELPADHHLRKPPTKLHAETTERMKTAEFRNKYGSWRDNMQDQFAWGEVTIAEVKEYWMRVLYHFEELFDASPKAPPPIKGRHTDV